MGGTRAVGKSCNNSMLHPNTASPIKDEVLPGNRYVNEIDSSVDSAIHYGLVKYVEADE